MAWKVLQQAAKDTPKEHKYVPWAVVDKKHMDEEHDELLTVVCKAYMEKGGSHAACNNTTKIMPMEEMDSSKKVSLVFTN
jgi:two-component SAPR family response regulator